MHLLSELAVWLSGNNVGHINQVTLHRARIVLRWVTVRGYKISVFNQTPSRCQPSSAPQDKLLAMPMGSVSNQNCCKRFRFKEKVEKHWCIIWNKDKWSMYYAVFRCNVGSLSQHNQDDISLHFTENFNGVVMWYSKHVLSIHLHSNNTVTIIIIIIIVIPHLKMHAFDWLKSRHVTVNKSR